MVFLETFKGVAKKVLGVEVLGVCGEHFRGVSGVFLRVFEAISKGVLKQSQWSLRKVSRKFSVSKGVLKQFRGSPRRVSRKFLV